MARFLDANVPMYAAGASHPLKESCQRIVVEAAAHPADYLTSAEVLQELIHRYRSQRRWQSGGRQAYWEFREAMAGRVSPVVDHDADTAAALADRYATLESRDLIHVAVMQRLGVTEIVSTDRAFDAIEEVIRIDPADWTPSR
jgi:uncharacterized protein